MAYFDLEEYDDYCVVRFFLGNIGPEYVEELEHQLAAVLSAASGDVVLDLGEVEGVSPEALFAFSRFRALAHEKGRDAAIAAANPEVLREARGLEPAFTVPCYATLDEVFQKRSPHEPPPTAPAAGQLFCDRADCVFNHPVARTDARRICTHEYAQMIGNPRNCRYFRLNWVEVSEDTRARVEPSAGHAYRPSGPAPQPAPVAIRTISEIDHAQGPLDQPRAHVRAAASPPPPSAAPVEPPSAVVKRYIEASNSMNFDLESDCLAPSMLGGTRDEYARKRREIFANLAKSGSVPQYYFLRLNREHVIEDQKATVDCVRGEVDSLGRRELRQVFQLIRSGDRWKISGISSGGRSPRPLTRLPRKA